MKKSICFLSILLSTVVYAQGKYTSSINWIIELLKNEPRIIYSLGNTGIVIDKTREIEIDKGKVKLFEYETGKQKSIHCKFYLLDLDMNRITVTETYDKKYSKNIYLVWIDTKDKLDLIIEYSSNGKSNNSYFTIYFDTKESANQFVYAIKQAISSAPEKIISQSNVIPGHMIRNMDWGMTIDDVKNLEKAELIEDSSSLKYRDTEFEENIMVAYYFKYNKLEFIIVDYSLNLDDDNQYLPKYMELKEKYKKLYGNPISDEEIWHDESLKNQILKYGYAISSGKLQYRTRFLTEFSEGIMNLMNKDGKPAISIAYKER